ncbi:DAK2 domain-containing protein [Dactylosporangium aurantiacum]|uniref:DAK2 domain-containing protein n=1 Tax=Dactylosporangium aurantiacum TaxID=35754 RepID=A0A9Q9IN71_9ACTN|nr:DAK2 domain-containing protein [Dactylosporangium aurantiacum]MDG6104417.1 DAK2 domain-containing protein [Dactylosporangium aurantiacum]UWZ56038.1 DAK2 domain-containing protein [Dactylosporangium aurantiacum]
MPESGDGAAVRRWCAAGLDALRRHRSEIDALNVYPVPDGDTGTNLALTMSAAADAVDAAPPAAGAADLLAVAARGALLGARGNSGIILAQLLKGLASSLASARAVGGPELAAALDSAARSAYAAVAAPVEGTVLSVATAAARAAASVVAASGGSSGFTAGGVVAVARAAAEGARIALARTPEQLPALARAGVVDAGGRGLVVLLEAFVTSLTGEAPPVAAPAPAGHGTAPGGVMQREAGSTEFGYEVQYLLDAPAAAIGPLREALGALGDSLVVVGDDPTWHVHVHVNDVGAAIEAGIAAGRPSRITVTRFAEQIAEQRSAQGPGPSADPSAGQFAGPSAGSLAGSSTGSSGGALAGQFAGSSAGPSGGQRTGPSGGESASRSTGEPVGAPAGSSATRSEGSGVVVVCTGRGIGELLAAEGATVLSGTPSTAEMLAGIRATGAARVVVLPNDANVLAVANAAAAEARAAGIRAGVVPTRSPVQALAAIAVRDTGRRFEDDVIAMAEAAARCRSAELTVAAREALTVAGRCQQGDVLAIVDGEVNLIGQDLERTACLLLDRMLAGGGELVTLIAGQGAPAGLGETLAAHVAGAWPFVEVQCYEGGQPHYPLLVGVE